MSRKSEEDLCAEDLNRHVTVPLYCTAGIGLCVLLFLPWAGLDVCDTDVSV